MTLAKTNVTPLTIYSKQIKKENRHSLLKQLKSVSTIETALLQTKQPVLYD